jgi:hypothetical protein
MPDFIEALNQLHSLHERLSKSLSARHGRARVEHQPAYTLASTPLLLLYQQYFPTDYAETFAALSTPDADEYTPREVEFLRLVDERLFPLDWDLVEDAWAIGRDSEIPIAAMSLGDLPSPEELDPGEWTHLRLGIQLLLLLTGQLPAEDACLIQAPPALDELFSLCGTLAEHAFIDETILLALCRPVCSPLRWLWLGMEWVAHETGNYWLDVHAEMPVMPPTWCAQDIEALRREYRQAQRLHRRLFRFLNWLERHPPVQRFPKVVSLWLQAILLSVPQRHAPRAR